MPAQRASTIRRALRVVLALACLGLVVALVGALGPRRVGQAVARADPAWLALSFALVAGRFLVWGTKWHRMLARRGPLRWAIAQRILMAGVFTNITLPVARFSGGLVRGLLLHRRFGWSRSESWGWALADQVTNALGSLVLYGTLALALGLASPASRTFRLTSGALALGAVAAFLWLRPRLWRAVQSAWPDGRLGRLLPRGLARSSGEGGADSPAGGDGRLQRALAPLLREGRSRDLAADVARSAVSLALLGLAAAVAIWAVGARAPVDSLALALALGYLAGNGFGVWGGIGLTEVALTGFTAHAGVPTELAAAGTLAHRAGFYLVGLSWGGWALARESREIPGGSGTEPAAHAEVTTTG